MHEGIQLAVDKELLIRGETIQVIKPKSVTDYNKGMLGVDVQDQFLSSHTIMRRCVKSYKKLFFYLIDMTMFNSFCIWKKIWKKKMHYYEYRLNIVEQILLNITLPEKTSPGRPSLQENPLRLQSKSWGHFPMAISRTEKKTNPTRNCKVCYKNGVRSGTRYICKTCQVELTSAHW